MENYTIYCTEEQTLKALKLGAPITVTSNHSDVANKKYYEVYHYESKTTTAIIIPTAEQMCGWLEEREIFIHIDYDFSDNKKPYKCEMCLFNGMTNHKGWFVSRQKATLAAIDAALDYLKKKQNK